MAVDNAGNKSEPRETKVYVELIPNQVRNFKAVNENGYIFLTWDASDRALGYLLEGSANGTVYGTSYLTPATATGRFTYTIRAVNEYGMSEPSKVTLDVTNINPVKPILEVDLIKTAQTYTYAEKRYDAEGNPYILKLEE